MLDSGDEMPETLYLQIDGGPENTAKSMLGMCELLIAKGMLSCVPYIAV